MFRKGLCLIFAVVVLLIPESQAIAGGTCSGGGGPGASSCSVSISYTIAGVSYTRSKSVTCSSGYACCTESSTNVDAFCAFTGLNQFGEPVKEISAN